MRSNRDTKLENIMESMYTPAADVVKENDEDTGRIPHDVDSFGDKDVDHHNQHMMDQDLLQPLHKAAQAAGADDITDYMIKQIKDQGDNWVAWFIDTVIGDEEDYDEATEDPVDEGSCGTHKKKKKPINAAHCK